jgi:choline-sulfatase
LFFEYSYVRGVRTPTRKLIVRAEGFPFEFYDLEKDPGESVNRIDDAAYAKEIAVLNSEMQKWFISAGAPPIGDWRSTTKQNLTQYGPFPDRK